MKLVPLGDRVVLQAVRSRRNYKIRYRSYRARHRKNHSRQRLVAVGPGGVVDGKEVKMEVKVGDKVIYSQICGNRCKIGRAKSM